MANGMFASNAEKENPSPLFAPPAKTAPDTNERHDKKLVGPPPIAISKLCEGHALDNGDRDTSSVPIP